MFPQARPPRPDAEGISVDYATAARTLVEHQPPRRLRWLHRWTSKRCAACRRRWPCPTRQDAGQAVLSAAGYVR